MFDENITKQIMQEYEKIRRENSEKHKNIVERIYNHIPRIKEIDDELTNVGLASCGDVLSGKLSPQAAVSRMKARTDELVAEKNELLTKNGVAPRIMTERFNCRKCRDRGIVDGQRCACFYQKAYAIMRKNSNLSCPEDHCFENFDLTLYEKKVDEEYGITPYANARSILDTAKSFVKGGKKAPKNILFYGKTGLGKTYTSDCIANEFLKQGKTVFYMSAPRLFKIFEDYRFGRDTTDTVKMAIRAVDTSDLLIIDDLGTEFRTPYTESILFDIVNSRLNENKSIIISTNLNTTQIANTYSDRISSRIIGGFAKVLFIGSDIRILKDSR